MKGGSKQVPLQAYYSEQWQRLHLDSPSLLLRPPHEKLQVHMDIMNAVGEIVTIEDVDDLGGSVRYRYRYRLRLRLRHGIAK